jgi:hypothetical protein
MACVRWTESSGRATFCKRRFHSSFCGRCSQKKAKVTFIHSLLHGILSQYNNNTIQKESKTPFNQSCIIVVFIHSVQRYTPVPPSDGDQRQPMEVVPCSGFHIIHSFIRSSGKLRFHPTGIRGNQWRWFLAAASTSFIQSVQRYTQVPLFRDQSQPMEVVRQYLAGSVSSSSSTSSSFGP